MIDLAHVNDAVEQHPHHVEMVDLAALVEALLVGQIEPVPDRDLVAPPELARDAPGLDVLEPVVIGLLARLGDDLGAPVAHRVEGGANDLLGIDEPLVGEHRLDDHLGAVAERLHDRLVLDEGLIDLDLFAAFRIDLGDRVSHREPLGVDLFDHLFARLEPVEPAQIVGHQVQRVDFLSGEGGARGDLLRAVGAYRRKRSPSSRMFPAVSISRYSGIPPRCATA